MITLNPGQKAAVEGVVSGFLESNEKGFVVIGEGGTGKTTSVMEIAQRLLDAGLKVLFCVPTNKAVKQLEKSAKAYGLSQDNVAFQTLHSALGLALLPNEEQKYAAQVGEGVFDIFDVCVCDEASMLGKVLLHNYLLPRAEEQNVKLLLMGDDMQLPPVKETKSLAFEIFPQYRLTQVERQSESSEILTVTGLLRTAIEGGKVFKHPAVQGAVETVRAIDFLPRLLEEFTPETDLEKVRVLAWRNRRVDDINAAIRTKIYGKDTERFEVGERVVTGAPIKGDESILLSTDEECIVQYCREDSLFDEDSGEDFRTYMLALKPVYAEGGQVFAHVLHEPYIVRQSISAPPSDIPAGKLAALCQLRSQSGYQCPIQLRNCLLQPFLGNTITPQAFFRLDAEGQPMPFGNSEKLISWVFLTLNHRLNGWLLIKTPGNNPQQ